MMQSQLSTLYKQKGLDPSDMVPNWNPSQVNQAPAKVTQKTMAMAAHSQAQLAQVAPAPKP